MKDGYKQGKELTICCSDVQNTATRAQRNPLAVTSSSVTVHIPTPGRHDDHRRNNLGGVVLDVQHPFQPHVIQK